jgi:PAS domain S-box-containing protein
MKSPLHILHLEDDVMDAELVQETLLADGIECEITRVETEADFLAALEQGGFDLVFADYSLPSFDGFSALKVVQRKCPDLPVIFVSGTMVEELPVEALKLGGTDYVLKARLPRIVPSVKRAVREAEEHAELARVEEALRRSEAYLGEAQKLSRTGSFGWKISSGKIYWSEETFRIFECDPATEPTLELINQRTHPKDKALIQQVIDSVSNESKDFDVEHRLLMPDGSVKYLHVVGRLLTDRSRSLEFIGAVTDITERKRAEEALRASENRWRKLFENSSAGIALVALEGRYLATNLALQKMLGYTEEEFQRLTEADLLPEGELAAHQQLRAEAVRGLRKGYRVERRFRRKDGNLIWTDVSGGFVPDTENQSAFFALVIVDINERKRAGEELRRSEAFLAQGQRISQTGIWRWRIATGEVYWSEERFRIFGYDPKTDKPSHSLFMERVHPEDRPRVEEILNQAIRDKSDFEFEYRIALPDGSIKFMRNVGQSQVGPSGELEFIGTTMDITERKRAEEELRQNEISLREAQNELAHVSRVTTMGELAASIAHEINQPLAGMLTNANAGLRWLAGELPNLNETREAVRRIIRDGNRAGEIIGRIRALAKKAPPQKDWLDLNQAIREVIAMARNEVTQNRVSLQTQLANDLPFILGDRIQLEQVILNLLINAIEAVSGVSEGPRELWVSSEKVTEVPGKPEEDTLKDKALAELEWTHVLIAVRDTGPGVDPKGLDRLFGAFYTTKPQGLGMGLAISRSIIEAHGGRLWAAANEPKGTVFQFALPIR